MAGTEAGGKGRHNILAGRNFYREISRKRLDQSEAANRFALNREAAPDLRPISKRRPKQDDELAEFEKPHRTADVACGGAR